MSESPQVHCVLRTGNPRELKRIPFSPMRRVGAKSCEFHVSDYLARVQIAKSSF